MPGGAQQHQRRGQLVHLGDGLRVEVAQRDDGGGGVRGRARALPEGGDGACLAVVCMRGVVVIEDMILTDRPTFKYVRQVSISGCK